MTLCSTNETNMHKSQGWARQPCRVPSPSALIISRCRGEGRRGEDEPGSQLIELPESQQKPLETQHAQGLRVTRSGCTELPRRDFLSEWGFRLHNYRAYNFMTLTVCLCLTAPHPSQGKEGKYETPLDWGPQTYAWSSFLRLFLINLSINFYASCLCEVSRWKSSVPVSLVVHTWIILLKR